MLRVNDLHAAYGTSQVLFGVELDVRQGEVVARLDRLKPHQIAHHGIGLVPEGRRVFPNLSAKENLPRASRHSSDRRLAAPA